MTEQEERWVKDTLALLGKQNVDRIAEIHVLTEVLAELLGKVRTRDRAAVLSDLQQRIKERQSQYLLKVKDWHPAMAAAIGKSPQAPA